MELQSCFVPGGNISPGTLPDVYLLVIGGPDSTRDLALQVDLGGPVSLPADRSHQDEAVPVGDESLGAIVRPSEVTHLQGTRHGDGSGG